MLLCEYISHIQNSRPGNHIREQDELPSPITPYTHDFLPPSSNSAYVLTKLPHQNMAFALEFLMKRPAPHVAHAIDIRLD